jgi:hypothetical protein
MGVRRKEFATEGAPGAQTLYMTAEYAPIPEAIAAAWHRAVHFRHRLWLMSIRR